MSATTTRPVVKKNELKIFKTRKEIKEIEDEGDKTSPANGPTRPQRRSPLVQTKRAPTTIGASFANNGIVRKAYTTSLNKAATAKDASPEGESSSPSSKPATKAAKEKKSVSMSPAKSPPKCSSSSRLANTPTSGTKVVGAKVATKCTTPATTRRTKTIISTTRATTAANTPATGKPASSPTKPAKQQSNPEGTSKKESPILASPAPPAKPIHKKAKSLSPIKGLRRRITGGGKSSGDNKQLATSADDLSAIAKAAGKKFSSNSSNSGGMSQGGAVDSLLLAALPTATKSSFSKSAVAQGTDSEERVSQTIHMEKKQTRSESFAEAIFKLKSRKDQCSGSQSDEPMLNKSREIARDECNPGNTRDLIVYLNPHKANASVSLTLGRSKTKKMISNSTSDLDKKSTKQISLDSPTNSCSPSHKSRSVSNQQLNDKTMSSADLLHVKFNQLKKSEALSEEEDLSDSLVSSSTLTNAIDGIGSCRTLPKFPRDSPPLSVHLEEETTQSQQQQSASNTQMAGKVESSKTTTSSKLADKLSRSFFDLTQGSQDRLQKWKSKLQKQCSGQHNHHQRGLREREKDTSEPPPRNRKMVTLGGAVPASSEMEILVDWTTSGPKTVESEQECQSPYARHPRALRSTHSASNAMNLVGKLSSPANSDTTTFKQANERILSLIASSANPLHKSHSLREPCTIRSGAVKSPVGSPASSNYSNSTSSSTMEHRTLRQHHQQFNDPPAISSTASKNFQQLLQSIEGYSAKNSYPSPDKQNRNSGELPPPARIMPFSGIKPQDNGIIHRPIAFRPVANGKSGHNGGNRVIEHRQSIGSELSTNFSISNSGQAAANGAAGTKTKKGGGVSSSIEHHKQTLKDHSRSIGNLVSATVTAPQQHAPHRPATNNNNNVNRHSTLQNASTSHSASSSHLYSTDPPKDTAQEVQQQNGHHHQPKPGNEENDYDTVPEFIDHKCFSEGDSIGNNSETYSLIYPYQNSTAANNMLGKVGNGAGKQQRGGFQQASTLSSRNTSSHSSGSSATTNNNPMVHSPIANKKSVNGVQQQQTYRHSGGVHITPSPSDSGIVDYETLIRDKENELSTVRHAMEQNEEVLIRVYQEKERQFKEQIGSLKQKLQDTQQHESSLYQQLCQSDDIRQQLQNSVRMLTEDRNAQQRKCQRMEKELDVLRNKLDNLERVQKAKACPSKCACNADTSSVDGSLYENSGAVGDKNRPPVPAPRNNFKDTNGSNQELRSEVDDLRGEICNLRDQLNNQIHFFTDERRRWEQERQQQQNIMQTSPHADLLPNVALNNKSSKPTPLSALYGAPYTKRKEVIMSTDRLI